MKVWASFTPFSFSLCLFSIILHAHPYSSFHAMALNPGVSIIVSHWGSWDCISDYLHPAPAHAGNTTRKADMETPPIYIHLVFGSSTEYEWVLNCISKSILNSNVIRRGCILSNHYLSGLSNIKSKHIGLCKYILCTDSVLGFPRDTELDRMGPSSPRSHKLLRQDMCDYLYKFINNSKIGMTNKSLSSVLFFGKLMW